jgi:hypothetical protein
MHDSHRLRDVNAFRTAVEGRDLDAMVELLAPDVVFNSPVAFRPFEGQETVGKVLEAVTNTFEDFRYTDELDGDDDTHVLVFRARVGDKDVEGIDLLRLDDDGRIADFTVMVRPASGLMALAEAMAPKVAGLK